MNFTKEDISNIAILLNQGTFPLNGIGAQVLTDLRIRLSEYLHTKEEVTTETVEENKNEGSGEENK